MSQTSSEQRYDGAIVDAMVDYCREIFEESFIQTPEVQRMVAIQLLQSGKFIDHAGNKYDIEAVATEQFKMETATRDPFSMVRQVVNVTAGITASQKSKLTTANPDVELRFHDAAIMPHGMAYAQRIVDTSRLLSLVSTRFGQILDIGGNYAAHALSAASYDVHSCTLLNGELEYHRQVQRNVALELADVHTADFCLDGAENCDVQAVHAISVHTLPNIDPDLWPRIFRNHGLQVVVAVFHYDVAMETDDVGYMPDCEMHWNVQGDDVHFHFDNDSSHGYVHKRRWLQRYALEWMATLPDWDYVVHYQVDFILHGRVQATMTRLDKNTLGYHEEKPQFRYIDMDEVVELLVPRYDESLGYSIHDARAYVVSPVHVPMPMFSHVYRYGVANDTERPDLPLTMEHIKSQVHSYNHVRRVNGTSITSPVKLSSTLVNDIALGMYLLVVKRSAMDRVVYGTYTNHMLALQRRWGDQHILSILAQTVTMVALAPFAMMTESVGDMLDMVTLHMRQVITEHKTFAVVQEYVPFRRLSPMRSVAFACTDEFVTTQYQPGSDVQLHPTIQLHKFYGVFRDVMEEDTRRRVEQYLEDNPDMEDEQMEVHVPSHELVPFKPITEDREEWIDAFRTFEQRFRDARLPPTTTVGVESVDRMKPQSVWEYYADRVYEYSMYNADVGMHVLAASKDLCRDTWGGDMPNLQVVHAKNVQVDAGIKYFAVNDVEVIGMDAADKYDVVIDPFDMSHKPVTVKGDTCIALGVMSRFVFVCENLRLFNNFTLAKRSYRTAITMEHPRDVESTLCDGVPGCGKTYQILQAFTIADIILVSVRDTKDAIYEELCAMQKFKPHVKRLKDRVRTLDSANIHGLPLASTLFVDEGLMSHSGALTMAVHQAHPDRLVVYGDNAQIGFIDRGSRIGNLHFQSLFYWTQVSEANESMRCPADAIMISALFYPQARRAKIKTLSPIMRSISFFHLPDIKDPAYRDAQIPYRYVAVLRADRGQLAMQPGFVDGKKQQTDDLSMPRPVYSVHEVQGRTFPFVSCYRMNIYNAEIFGSEPHLNVMFTRHTLRFQYRGPCTPAQDPAAALAVRAMAATDEELRSYMLPTPQWLQDRMLSQQTKFAAYMM